MNKWPLVKTYWSQVCVIAIHFIIFMASKCCACLLGVLGFRPLAKYRKKTPWHPILGLWFRFLHNTPVAMVLFATPWWQLKRVYLFAFTLLRHLPSQAIYDSRSDISTPHMASLIEAGSAANEGDSKRCQLSKRIYATTDCMCTPRLFFMFIIIWVYWHLQVADSPKNRTVYGSWGKAERR